MVGGGRGESAGEGGERRRRGRRRRWVEEGEGRRGEEDALLLLPLCLGPTSLPPFSFSRLFWRRGLWVRRWRGGGEGDRRRGGRETGARGEREGGVLVILFSLGGVLFFFWWRRVGLLFFRGEVCFQVLLRLLGRFNFTTLENFGWLTSRPTETLASRLLAFLWLPVMSNKWPCSNRHLLQKGDQCSESGQGRGEHHIEALAGATRDYIAALQCEVASDSATLQNERETRVLVPSG